MKRTLILLAGALASAAGAAAIASAHATVTKAHASAAAKVEVRRSRLGSILTTSSGLTLYLFSRDRSGEDSCVKVHECARFWPPLRSSGTPLAGAGVKRSLLSTIKVPGGARQVTYAGHALYTYTEDTPGSTGYVGVSAFGGGWYALNASGHEVR